MRVKFLALSIALVAVGAAQSVGHPDARPTTTWIPPIDDRCPCCVRYSSPDFQRRVESLAPWCSNRMPRRVKEKLFSGFRVAVERLCTQHDCHILFSRLGADGIDVLNGTLYYPANLYREQHLCKRATAFSKKGVSQTWLCRGFASVPDEAAARILIHEALHRAGLGEHSPKMSPSDTDIAVIQACGF